MNATISLEVLNKMSETNMVGHLGIEFTEVATDYICAKMPVDSRTKQPMGLLHGSAGRIIGQYSLLSIVGRPRQTSGSGCRNQR
jgi:1,4-dihydroxy-2-naphthoyl-CoA hydrolase